MHLCSGCRSPFCAQYLHQRGPGGQDAARAWWVKAGEQQESRGVPSSLCPMAGCSLPSAADAAQGRLHSFLAPLLILSQELLSWPGVCRGIFQCASIPCHQGPSKLALSIFPESRRCSQCSWLWSSFLERKTMEKMVSARLEISLAPAGPAQLKWWLGWRSLAPGSSVSCSCVPAPRESSSTCSGWRWKCCFPFLGDGLRVPASHRNEAPRLCQNVLLITLCVYHAR